MIFVSVGNANQGFYRLLSAVDEFAGSGGFGDEKVLIQTGTNRGFKARFCQQVDFLGMEEFSKAVSEANLVISHGGAGTLYHVFQSGKIPVVMPRRVKYKEHVDDQFNLVENLAREGRIIPVYEPEDLPDAVEQARKTAKVNVSTEPVKMIHLITQAINDLSERK